MIPRRIALTGASGMVGLHVAAWFATHGWVCAASSRTAPSAAPRGQVWSPWDLREWKEPDELDALFPDVDALVHLGATVPAGDQDLPQPDGFDANVRACLCLARWALARGIPVVYLSGAIVYAEAEGPGPLNEEAAKTTRTPGGFYGFSKLLAEQVFDNAAGSGLRVVNLRASSIYGAGMAPDKMITSFLKRADAGETIHLTPPTGDRINLIHAADVAAAIAGALDRDAWGTFNIAGAASVSIREIAEACTATVEKGRIEIAEGVAGRPPINRFPLDCSAARRTFGFESKVPLSQGLARTFEQSTENGVTVR